MSRPTDDELEEAARWLIVAVVVRAIKDGDDAWFLDGSGLHARADEIAALADEVQQHIVHRRRRLRQHAASTQRPTKEASGWTRRRFTN